MHRFTRGALLVIVLTASPSVSAAQQTGTPMFKAPYRAFTTHEVGAALSDDEGVSFALEGFYRYGTGQNDVSLRGGFSDRQCELGNQVLVGGDCRTQILSYSDAIPLDGSLTVGFGASVGDGPDFFRLPVGISLGRRFEVESSETTFVPYALRGGHPASRRTTTSLWPGPRRRPSRALPFIIGMQTTNNPAQAAVILTLPGSTRDGRGGWVPVESHADEPLVLDPVH